MPLATLLFTLPLALDGESANTGNTAIGVISVVSIVSGYLLLAALWFFVFRGKAREKRKKRSSPDWPTTDARSVERDDAHDRGAHGRP
jgi:hypothetical protein